MKRVVLALVCFLLVLSAAVLRPRLSATPQLLPVSPRGVVLVAVEGLGISEARAVFGKTAFSGYGLMPTRNGTADDSDFSAGLRMILSGSRTPKQDAPTLLEITRQNGAFFQLHSFTGTNAVRDAATLVAKLTSPNGLSEGRSILVVGVTPSGAALQRRERVAPVFFWTRKTPTVAPRLLTSPSTRHRTGLIAATDIPATVAALLDLPPKAQHIGDGRSIALVPVDSHLQIPSVNTTELLMENLQRQGAIWGLQAREQKQLPVIPWILAGLFALATFVPNASVQRTTRTMVLSLPLALITFGPFVPVGTFAFTFPDSFVFFLATIPVLILGIMAGLKERLGNHLPRILAIATALTIAVDTCTGGFLLSRTPLSYSVLEAARFYGIGNEISGLFLGAAVVVVGAGQGTIATLLWGLTTAFVLGAPALGADAGGFIAALVAFAVLALARRERTASGAKQNNGRFLIAGIAVLLAITAFALWDGSRPASSRTHIGEAVATAREKGWESIATIIKRKALVNVRLLTASPWAVLLYVQVITLAWGYHKKKRQERVDLVPDVHMVQSTLLATTLTLFALNDSGVVAGATCGCWLLGTKYSGEPPHRVSVDFVPIDSTLKSA